MLKLYRWPTDDWRKLGADLPPEIIWIDLLNPSDDEKQFVERRLDVACLRKTRSARSRPRAG